jgi:hypothetical protein
LACRCFEGLRFEGLCFEGLRLCVRLLQLEAGRVAVRHGMRVNACMTSYHDT